MDQTPASTYATPRILRETSQGVQATSLLDEMFAQRQIEIVGEVNDAMTYSVCQQLRFLQRENPNAEITVFFSSLGGSVSGVCLMRG